MIVAAAAVMTTFSGFAQNPTDAEVLKSPDGNLELRFAITAAGTPTYSLNYGGKAVILPSELGYLYPSAHGTHPHPCLVRNSLSQRARDSIVMVVNERQKKRETGVVSRFG